MAILSTTADVVATPKEKCYICKRYTYTGVLQCRKCEKVACNLHFCDVCRHCVKHCTCWQRPNTVYHPPPDEPPAR